MNTLLSMWLLTLNHALVHDTDYMIAQYFVTHYQSLPSISITSAAGECFTSPATINKFCQKFGFQSFQDMKSQSEYFYNIRIDQMMHRFDIFDESELKQYFSKDTWDSYVELANQAAQLIHESQQTTIVGATYPLALASNFQEDMIMMGKLILYHQCLLFRDTVSFGESDVLMVVSVTGRIFSHNQELYNRIFNSGAKIILISQQLFCDRDDASVFIKIPGNTDDEFVNFRLLAIYYLIKYRYFCKFYKNKM